MNTKRAFLLVSMVAASSSRLLAVVADPLLSPTGGSFDAAFPLTITCATPGAVIHYTLNGMEPTLADPTYSTPLTINRNWSVKAKAWRSTETSNTVTASFQVSGSVASGVAHSLAMKGTGAMLAWGLQTNGRLGNNQSAASNVTSPVASLYAAGTQIGNGSLIAAGADHTVFLKNDNSVWSFGTNATGQLGDNSTSNRLLAVPVRKSTTATDYLTGCVSVAAGNGFSSAVFYSTGEVYTWGNQAAGRLGNGSTTAGTRLYAGKVYQGTSGTTPLTGIKWVAAGGASALGLDTTTGKVWAWGENTYGQLGQGNLTTLSRAAVAKINSTTDLTDVTDISCGGDHSAFVRWKTGDPNLQGRVFCVGRQQYGRLGDNVSGATNRLYADQAVLKAVGVPLANIDQVAAGPGFTLALDTAGNVWAWGRNEKGVLGTGNTTDSSLAVAVKKPDGTGQLGNIVRIAAGGVLTTVAPIAFQTFALAVASDGTVYAWGHNANGQLGRGGSNVTNSSLPVVVTGGLDLSAYPDVDLVCSISPVNYSNSVVLTALPSSAGSTVTSVDFMVDGVLQTQVNAAPWTATVSGLSNGTHHVYAVATDAAGIKDHSLYADFTVSSDPLASNLDADGDGVIDSAEAAMGTSATDADTDQDGIPDGSDSQPLIPSTVTLAAASTLMVWSPLE